MRCFVGKIRSFSDDETKFIFVFTVILMFIAHGFCFLNIMYSHDSVSFSDINYTAKVNLGRWLYPVCIFVRNMATPWMMGILSTLYVSIAVILVTKLLELNRLEGICVSILFVTNIALISLFSTFSFDADADCLALVFACLAAYAYDRNSGKRKFIIPVLCIVGCLALYQAYIDVTIGLFLFILINKLNRSTSKEDIGRVLRTGFQEIGILVSSTFVYLITVIITSKITGISIGGDYNSAGNVSSLNLKSIILIIPRAYGALAKRLIYPDARNNFFVLLATTILFVVTCISLFRLLRKNKDYPKKNTLMVIILILLPLGLNAIFVISLGVLHYLMVFAYYLIFLLPLLLLKILSQTADKEGDSIERDRTRRLFLVSFVSIIVIGFNNVIFSNAVYTYKKIVYDNTLLHAHTVWQDVNELDGYKEGETAVVFVGKFTDSDSNAAYESYISDHYSNTFHAGFTSSIAGEWSLGRFYERILGRDMNIVHPDLEQFDSAVIADMPVYPYDGYCRLVGDTVIVKMSNSYE